MSMIETLQPQIPATKKDQFGLIVVHTDLSVTRAFFEVTESAEYLDLIDQAERRATEDVVAVIRLRRAEHGAWETVRSTIF